MKKFAVSFLCFVFSWGIMGQGESDNMDKFLENRNLVIDSLKSALNSSPNNIEIITSIIENYKSIDQDSLALWYINGLIENSKIIKTKEEIGQLMLNKAEVLSRLNEDDAAISLILKGLEDKRFYGEKQKTRASSLMSRYYNRMYNYDLGLKYAFEVEGAQLENNDSLGLSNTYSSIAKVYLKLSKIDDCIEYFKKANRFCPQRYFHSKITIMLNIGMLQTKIGDEESALAYAKNAEKIANREQLYEIYPGLYKTLGIIYNYKKEWKKSLSYCLKSLKYAEKMNTNRNMYLSLYKYIALAYYQLGDYRKAIEFFERLDEFDVDHLQIKESNINLSNSELLDAYVKVGDYKMAYETFREYSIIKDSFVSEAQNLKLTEITEKYENGKKQQQIDQLSSDNLLQNEKLKRWTNFIYGSIAFSFLLMVIGFITYLNNRNKQKLKEATLNLTNSRLQHRFLRTQLNPHFLFHALSSIESYIYRGKKEEAASFLQNFSKLMRTILESSDVDFISLKEDLSFIEKYLELQQLNHGFAFDYSIVIDDDINTENIMIPPMLTQPFVENAILHGAIRSNGKVAIIVKRNLQNLLIEIEDNGSSGHVANDSKKLNRSMSTNIVKQRIKNLRDIHDIKITYSINRNELDANTKSTSIVISIPLVYSNFKKVV